MKLSSSTKLSENFKNLSEIKVGEIRRLIDMELKNDSRLVVIVSVNRADESAQVVMVNNLLEIATPRDILLSTDLTESIFELVLLPDFVTNVWKQQLETSPVYGRLDPSKIQGWMRENSNLNDNLKSINRMTDLDTRGVYLPEFADHVWLFRSKEIDALNVLGHVPEIYVSNYRFYEIWRKPNESMKLTDLILENDLDVSLIDNFFSNDSIRLELV